MTDRNTLPAIVDADAEEPSLSAADARAMRQVVVAAARQCPALESRWRVSRWIPMSTPPRLAVGAAGVALIGLGTASALRFDARARPGAEAEASLAQRTMPAAKAVKERLAAAGAEADSERRQLHFASPGGTRIIWVFNPDLSLKETMP